jgi:CRP-like cAMP-binding protein
VALATTRRSAAAGSVRPKGLVVPTANVFAPSTENLLLAQLPAPEQEHLAPLLRLVRLEHKQVLYAPDQRIDHVYFPLNAVLSVLTVMGDGDSVEVGTIGNEGMAGLPLVHDTARSSHDVIAQVPGDALALDTAAFTAQLDRHTALDRVVHHYAQGFLNMVSQTAACNRLHDVDERCARWLLMTHDRVHADTFPLTHEFLSQMLGVRRAGVTVALGILRRAGLIATTPGQVTIVDRDGLEDVTCECYRMVRDEFDQLLGT